jgi:(p)ppGpp synthase/HD superfamily hydrolase
MLAVAQTNLQLYNQLLRLNYSHHDLDEVRAAYELARELFSGLYRPSGKTFIAHLIGTASILAECLVDTEVIHAGLLHAAYTAGDFGYGTRGVSDARRDQLVEAIGARAEAIVHRYSEHQWPPANPDNFRLLASTDNSASRDAALVRLANELEEYIDLGVYYCHEHARKRILLDPTMQDILTNMAKTFGYEILSAALSDAFTSAPCADVPDVARSREISGKSVLIPPKTYQKVMQLVTSRIDAQTGPKPLNETN